MQYISTRGKAEKSNFCDAVMTGLARDGGLIMPEFFPDFSDRLEQLSRLGYCDLAYEIMRPFADDIPDNVLHEIIRKSYLSFRDSEITPVKRVGPVYILELFHGPTLAFKDVALQFLGNLFEYILGKRGGKLNIIAATSGDTGSAAIYGVRGRRGITIFVMHPDGRVSPVQEMQMTSVTDHNVFNIAIDGTFDDAQAIVKSLFADLEFKDRNSLGAVNSINWARVLAQIVYYFYAGLKIRSETGFPKVSFCVPTGNFGDIFAGYSAAMMGLPVDKLILATNENDILSRFFNSGVYKAAEVVPTISPSMDIQAASNFERWIYLHFSGNSDMVRDLMRKFALEREIFIDLQTAPDKFISAGRAGTAEALETIKRFYGEFGYVLDPHSAVGVSVALSSPCSKTPIICLATAHPAKFPQAIKDATGIDGLAKAPQIEALKTLPTLKFKLPSDKCAVANFIERKLSSIQD